MTRQNDFRQNDLRQNDFSHNEISRNDSLKITRQNDTVFFYFLHPQFSFILVHVCVYGVWVCYKGVCACIKLC
jgi:hypothetical protein